MQTYAAILLCILALALGACHKRAVTGGASDSEAKRDACALLTKEEIQAAVSDRIRGNFFAVSPADVRAGLEKLPWVRAASVRRVWPDRLEVALEEHVALARWGVDTP